MGGTIAVHVGRGVNINRAALNQVCHWFGETPHAGVGVVLPDRHVSVVGDATTLASRNLIKQGKEEVLFQSLVLSTNGSEVSEMIVTLDAGKVLPDSLEGGLLVRPPGDFIVPFSGTHEVDGVGRELNVDVAYQRPARAPEWLAALTEAAPKAVCDVDVALSSAPVPVQWLCRDLGIAPGRPTVIGGFAGGGKSPFAAAFAVSVALGRPFLGMSVRHERVAWAAFEAAPVAHTNLQRLARTAGEDPGKLAIDVWSFRGKLNERGTLSELRRRVRDGGHGVLIVDSYASALQGIEHNSSSFGDGLRQLEKLSDESGCVVIVLMHTAKKSEVSGSREIAGHFSAVASSQAVLILTRPDPDKLTRLKVSCARSLFSPFEPFEIEFRDVHNPPSLETPSWGLRLKRCDEDELGKFILGLIEAVPGTNQRHIVTTATGMGHGRNETVEALQELEDSGALRVEKARGASHKYWIADSATRAA